MDTTAPQEEKTNLGAGHFIKNSVANVITGASSALLNLFVPSVLARHLGREEFSAWALILQMAAYTSLLSLGMQIAVGRFVALAREKEDVGYASAIVSTAFLTLAALTAVALTAVCGMAVSLRGLFPSIPESLIPTARITLLIVGGTLAVGLPFTALNGVFTGYQRNEIVAAITGTSRALLTAALVGVALGNGGMILMGLAFAAIYIASYGFQFAAFRRLYGGIGLALGHFSRKALHELGSYCASITVWSVSMLMVSGLDIAIVGRVDFSFVAGYASCVGLITFINGVQSALFSPLLQVGTALHAQGAAEELGALLVRSIRLCAVVLLAVASPLLLFSHEIMALWLGPIFTEKLTYVLGLLIAGNVLRLLASPYALLLLATAQHKRTYLSPLIEGLVNLSVCLVAGFKYGVMGVAFGTLSGACVGQIMNLFYNLPRTKHVAVSVGAICKQAIAQPLLAFVPIALAGLLVTRITDAHLLIRSSALVLSIFLCWRFSMDSVERTMILAFAAKILNKMSNRQGARKNAAFEK